MTRLHIVVAAVLSASATMNAAQIQIGQYVGNSASGASQGLTSSYMTGGSPCVGQLFQGNACVAANKQTWFETNYNTSLFAGATNGGTSPSAYSGYSATSTTAGSTITKNGETFAMVNDSAGGTRNDWYASTTSPANVFTIPVGISGVDDVYMMLNNMFGVAGAQDADVFFTFGSTSNATTGLTIVEVELTNSGTYNSGPSGQIQDAISCTSGANGSAFATCSQFDGGPTLASSHPTTLVNGVAQDIGVTVTTTGVYGSAYNGNSAAALNYQGTSGNIQLNDLGFLFGSTYQNMYLVSIGIAENSATGPPSSANPNSSDLILSAITLDAVTSAASSTPEPSTWMLLLGGISVMGIGRLRRRS